MLSESCQIYDVKAFNTRRRSPLIRCEKLSSDENANSIATFQEQGVTCTPANVHYLLRSRVLRNCKMCPACLTFYNAHIVLLTVRSQSADLVSLYKNTNEREQLPRGFLKSNGYIILTSKPPNFQQFHMYDCIHTNFSTSLFGAQNIFFCYYQHFNL